MPKQCSSNTESRSVLVIVGDCGGREVEQEEKKTPLNAFSCLVKHSSRGVTVSDDKQRHAPFLLFHLHSQATAQPVNLKGQIASRCVLILYLAVHYQLFIIQISWGMMLKRIWRTSGFMQHMYDLALQVDPLFHTITN